MARASSTAAASPASAPAPARPSRCCRLPVRIELVDGPLADHPLRVGLSMFATVQLDSGAVAAAAPGRTVAAAAADPDEAAEAAALAEADRLVREIIEANLKPAAVR